MQGNNNSPKKRLSKEEKYQICREYSVEGMYTGAIALKHNIAEAKVVHVLEENGYIRY